MENLRFGRPRLSTARKYYSMRLDLRSTRFIREGQPQLVG